MDRNPTALGPNSRKFDAYEDQTASILENLNFISLQMKFVMQISPCSHVRNNDFMRMFGSLLTLWLTVTIFSCDQMKWQCTDIDLTASELVC